MAPKARGRRTDEQIRRETEGLKWKSASTLDRQRKRKKNRQNKEKPVLPREMRQRQGPRRAPLLPHRGHALVAGEDVLDDEASSEASLSEPGPSAPAPLGLFLIRQSLGFLVLLFCFLFGRGLS